MIHRFIQKTVVEALERQAAVAIIGPRQVGKTTLAMAIGRDRDALYLDLESQEDRAKLAEPALFLKRYEERLVILDEIHRAPEIFQTLRGLIDQGRRSGRRTGRFLILGSASVDLLRQSGESLAGRIEYVDMGPLTIAEVEDNAEAADRLWLRGGFPDSYLFSTNSDSMKFRKSFIRTYLERDVSQFGPRIPSETLGRLWTMLAHNQGTLLNASRLAASLSVSAPTVTTYVDLLSDLLLVRRLQPFHANVGKRLVKSPKVYVRDSGLVHALLGITELIDLFGHPVVGPSWEGFAIENLVTAAPVGTQYGFFRTASGAEIDLLLELPGKDKLWAIEFKRSLAPKVEKGFHIACDDLKPSRRFLVYPGQDSYPISSNVEVVDLKSLYRLLSSQ